MDPIIHLLSGDRGIYLPQNFAEMCGELFNLSVADRAILLAGPDGDPDDPGFDYWDTWCRVVDTATAIIDGRNHSLYLGDSGDLFSIIDGHTYSLYLGGSGDLFALCPELMSLEDQVNFFDIMYADDFSLPPGQKAFVIPETLLNLYNNTDSFWGDREVVRVYPAPYGLAEYDVLGLNRDQCVVVITAPLMNPTNLQNKE